MSAAEGKRELVVHYLLGGLSPEQQEELESAYLEGDDLYQQLLAAEEELIDDYVGGSLSSADRRRFEQHFLSSPRRRERLAFARSFAQVVAAGEEVRAAAPRRRFWPLAAAGLVMATLLTAASFLWLWPASTELARMRVEREVLRRQASEWERQVATETLRSKQLAEQVAMLQGATPGRDTGSDTISWTLTPGLERDVEGASRRLEIPAKARWLRLRLLLDPETPLVGAVLVQTVEGQELVRLPGLRTRTQSGAEVVEVMLPVDVLEDGTLLVSLVGPKRGPAAETVATYSLWVARAR